MNIKKTRIFIIILLIIIPYMFTYFKLVIIFFEKIPFNQQNLKINFESKRFSWYELMS
jgi:hypothetical protein